MSNAQNLVTFTEFATLAGVHPSSISRASKTKALVDAVQGDKIWVDHPVAREYIDRKHKGRKGPVQKPMSPATRDLALVRREERLVDLQSKLRNIEEMTVDRAIVDQVFRRLEELFADFIHTGAKAIALQVCKSTGMESVDEVETIIRDHNARALAAISAEILSGL